MNTKITDLFGIRYPIVQGGMQNLGVPAFAAAVSNAGGMGTLNASTYETPERFRDAVREMKQLTDKPFFVNISLVPGVDMGEATFRYINICAEEGVPAIETAGASPDPYLKTIKDAGIKLVHKAPTVRHAKRMEKKGADAVTIAGFEVAGHPGEEAVGTFVLANRTARELSIPVLAAGGIADGRGLAAALLLGAEGVVIGTRLVASEECAIHQNFKDLLVGAAENQTALIQRSIRNTARVYNNDAAQRCLELEAQGASLEELMQVIAGTITRDCYRTGDTARAIFACGPAAGLVGAVRPVAQILEEMVAEAEAELARVSSLFAH